MEESNRELRKKICVHLLVCLGAILTVVFVVPPLFKLFLPLIIAWLIALLANPLVRFLENRIKIMRKHGTVIVIVFVLAIICAAIYGIICFTAVQVSSLIAELPDLYQSVISNLQEAMSNLHDRFNIIPADIQSMFGKRNMQLNEYILTALKSLKTSPVSTVGNVASSLIDFFVLLILTLMMTYFFVADHDKIKEAVAKHMPGSVKRGWNMVKDIIVKAIGGYLKACFQIMIVIFVILFVIFLLMGQKYAALIAFITAFLDFLPFVGTGTILTPWAIYCVITGEYTSAVILVAAYFITLFVHRILEPKLIGDSVGMSPFLTLISMFIFYRLIGMLGLIIGIPVGMVLQAFYEGGVFDNTIRGIKILVKDINEYRKF
ncbi:sporulation integral membrane protein YtvI [Eubacterium sp. MSJ-13]|uniref:sporulation integral membrane protein YtvI n=1 Tax=Eubacterium sp. MSJ-13 TaxID=2841513 RepID=UPI001C123455|nr:sporulation integral membrane protein YtvI [Eubacterium sp. MSJ-13]MBU5478660.1 sporulation integral membrane protein YtvI [Eubacterium sp. MSJ-13]